VNEDASLTQMTALRQFQLLQTSNSSRLDIPNRFERLEPAAAWPP
jgi:hypothetical protein